MNRKEASSKTNAARILDRAGILYDLRTYAVDEGDLSAGHVAAAIGLPPEQVFKTLVARGDRTGVLLACIVSFRQACVTCKISLSFRQVLAGV